MYYIATIQSCNFNTIAISNFEWINTKLSCMNIILCQKFMKYYYICMKFILKSYHVALSDLPHFWSNIEKATSYILDEVGIFFQVSTRPNKNYGNVYSNKNIFLGRMSPKSSERTWFPQWQILNSKFFSQKHWQPCCY